MAAGGFKEFVAGETLDEDEINDYLMQGMLVFAGTAARGSAIGTPVEGQFSFLKDTDSVEFYDGSAWVPFESGLTYATIGTAATGSFTDGGIDYDYWDFTSNGSLVISEGGLLDILVVGGGGGLANDSGRIGQGGGGAVRYGTFEVAAGTVAIAIGAGGADSTPFGGNGGNTTFGSLLYAGGGQGGLGMNAFSNITQPGFGGGGSPGARKAGGGGQTLSGGGQGASTGVTGITLNYNGSSIEYGIGGNTGASATSNDGRGSSSGVATAAAGRVIVRVRT